MPARGFARRRALVSIAFFQLTNPARKELFRERARQIVSVYGFLQNRQNAGDVWDLLIDAFAAPSAPHTSCTRSFLRLYDSNRPEADEVFTLAAEFLASVSG
jgi:hypothetical protein